MTCLDTQPTNPNSIKGPKVYYFNQVFTKNNSILSILENENILKVDGDPNDVVATETSRGAIEIKNENQPSSSKLGIKR